MGYRNSTLYTLKYVADMLGEDEDFLHECSIEMFSEDGRLSAYDNYPASELTEHIVLFTEDGIENLKYIIEARRTVASQKAAP
ncbi:hypothetical protein KBI52_08070 [Microvirga sp. HBU67558]|uniref:hypothetical protein n=1 Tax=Microvirga TaxID=186650 RepID=UPI001B37733B|nr:MULTISPECIES: hypothetical protein [unclassified Microvirga]MBQ0820166.1 hypothetical protein [Microvirga sp. HBU67558]